MTRWRLEPAHPQSVFDEDGVNVLTRLSQRDMQRIAAAPEMEDALLETVRRTDPGDLLPCWCRTDEFCGHDSGCEKARAVLRASGRIP